MSSGGDDAVDGLAVLAAVVAAPGATVAGVVHGAALLAHRMTVGESTVGARPPGPPIDATVPDRGVRR